LKIISIKNGFTSDHSSTSYEFLAVNKPLGKKEKAAVASLSSRANPTSRRVSFIYHADGYDIPGGWEALMEKYYDVMYRESYDWWTLSIAFDSSAEQVAELREYEFTGQEDLGIELIEKGNRVIVLINCRLTPPYSDEPYNDYYDDEDDDYDEEEDADQFVAEDELLNLLVQLREQLKQRDYRALYTVWEEYGFSVDDFEDEEFEAPPVPTGKQEGKRIIEQFRNMLDKV